MAAWMVLPPALRPAWLCQVPTPAVPAWKQPAGPPAVAGVEAAAGIAAEGRRILLHAALATAQLLLAVAKANDFAPLAS